ncbi:GatB/YqeY domain-containing protein [Flexivirga meconopsidis]|uniref:GatB/YqeY domain-containing protein n=1 Tax=Flexivirga meconopsidis TaxID=2977121 RepID=UPI00223F5A38|nr:GatB/YqeY domain-containing protein [Flexivirga meconopsidis]
MTAIETVRTRLRTDLRQAMRDRDSDRACTLRGALAALDNAEAVPTDARAGAIEQASVGAGSTEAVRRELGTDDIRAIFQAEISERRSAATDYESAAPDHAAALRAEAETLSAYLSDLV